MEFGRRGLERIFNRNVRHWTINIDVKGRVKTFCKDNDKYDRRIN